MSRDYNDPQYDPELDEVSLEDSMPAYLRNEKLTMADFQKHLSGPLISIVAHVIILVVVGSIVIAEAPKPPKDEIQVQVKKMEIVEPPPPPPPEEQVEVQEVTDFTDVPMDRPQMDSAPSTAEVVDVTMSNAVSDVDVPPMPNALTMSNSALQIPMAMAGRSGGARQGNIKRYGGTTRGEQAVLRALRWLAKVQNEDGSWGDNTGAAKYAQTAVATLTFLAHGETPQSPEFGNTVMRAFKIMSQWADNLAPGKSLDNGYANAMVAYALSEGFAMTKIPMLQRAMDKMIATIVGGMNSLGGYDYNYNKNVSNAAGDAGAPRCDLSLAGWNYQAMKAAYAADCTVEGLHAAIEKGAKCIRTVNEGTNGSFTYSNSNGKSGGNASMTSVGTLCLQLFGYGNSKEAKAGLKWLLDMPVGGEPTRTLTMSWRSEKDMPSGNMPLYTWYYYTQAVFQGTNNETASGDMKKLWTKWNKSFNDTLCREQSQEGYWDSPTVKYHKPENKDNDGNHGFKTELGQRVWSTSMCTLMLEVYYRFLPSFKVTASKPAGAATATATENDEDLSL